MIIWKVCRPGLLPSFQDQVHLHRDGGNLPIWSMFGQTFLAQNSFLSLLMSYLQRRTTCQAQKYLINVWPKYLINVFGQIYSFRLKRMSCRHEITFLARRRSINILVAIFRIIVCAILLIHLKLYFYFLDMFLPDPAFAFAFVFVS